MRDAKETVMKAMMIRAWVVCFAVCWAWISSRVSGITPRVFGKN
jgi:hypothetical protein